MDVAGVVFSLKRFLKPKTAASNRPLADHFLDHFFLRMFSHEIKNRLDDNHCRPTDIGVG